MSKINHDEPEKIALELTRLVGATYRVFQPTKKFPPGGKAEWMIQSADLENARRTFHFDALWKEGRQIFAETRDVASLGEWVTWDYGESALATFLKMDFTNVNNPEVKETLFKQFPKLESRIARFEDALERLSAEHQVRLRISYDGGKGVVILYMQAVLNAGDFDSEIGQIKRSELALKSATEEIARL